MNFKEFMKSNFEWKSALAFALVCLVLLGDALISARNMATVLDNGGWVTHTYQVIGELQTVQSMLKEVQAAQRSYIITGDKNYQNAYSATQVPLRKHLDRLKFLVSDNPPQEARMKNLEVQALAEISRLQQGVDLYNTNPAAIDRAVLADDSKARMGGITDTIAEATRIEQDLLARRQVAVTASERNMRLAFAATTAASLLLLSLVYGMTMRAMRERRASAEAIARREEWLSTTLRSIGDAVLATDAQGRILFFNSVAERLTGWKQREAVGKASDLVFVVNDPETGQRVEGPVAAVLRTSAGTILDDNRLLVARDGRQVIIDDSGAPMHDAKGRLIGTVVVFRDITARKEAEEELRAAKEAAETANRTKSQFLANMSHELRTPMNAIIGYSEMLQEEAHEEGQDSMVADLQKIHGAGKHLLALINDILDLSKIEAGKMELFLETFDVPATVREIVTTVEGLVEKNGNRLIVQCDDALGTMYGDLTKVRQNLLNLLSNAAKFTSEGQITLNVTPHAQNGRAGYAFQITDEGVGMTPEQIGRLFEVFSQADASTTRKFGGTGLGLAITRHFCRMMGGDVSVQSEAGKGSTFTMWLPAVVSEMNGESGAIGADAPVTPNDAVTALVGGMNPVAQNGDGLAGHAGIVLVIDDDPTARGLMQRLLGREGFRVEVAANGPDGLRMARELRPVAITLDVMMPSMDGWTVLTTLKDDPELCDIPVIMLTMVDNKNLGIRLGASDYMTKPVDRDRLNTILSKYRCKSQPCNVLLVEDDETTRHMMREMLQHAGWTVTEAENGQAALDLVKAHQPELILLDLMMPMMDGFEFVSHLQQNMDWREIPIIVLTAKDVTAEDRLRLNGYVEKVLQKGATSREELLDDVRSLVVRSVNDHAARKK